MSDAADAFRSSDSPNAPFSKKSAGSGIFRVLALVGIVVLLLGLFLPATRSARPAVYRMVCSNNLKQIALALRNYEDVYGTLPPAHVTDADGAPMHSWRVLVLPFLEEHELYERYRFDEPWNGPNNSRLADEIPPVYRCPSFSPRRDQRAEPTDSALLTQYVLLCNENTPLSGSRAIATGEIKYGAGDTPLVAELDSECVHWMAPRDIDMAGFVRVLSKSKHRRQHTGGLHALMADGSVQFISQNSAREVLQRHSAASDGETPP